MSAKGTLTLFIVTSVAMLSQVPSGRAFSSQQLIDDVVWSIAHEGCDVFLGNEMRDPTTLQYCYAAKQRATAESEFVRSTSTDQIVSATLEALTRIWDEYKVRGNFQWVMEHEGRKAQFVELTQHGRFEEIRSIYKSLQSHNEYARNALSALRNVDIADLVAGRKAEHEPPDAFASTDVSTALKDHTIWAITEYSCAAFDGEALLPPERLRDCYLKLEKLNHNGEAYTLFKTASPDTITLATTRAIIEIKRTYDVKQAVGWFFVYTRQLDYFRQLLISDQVWQIRSVLASLKDEAKDVPHLWNALADSEIAAVVSQVRLDIVIPADAPRDTLEAVATLLDTKTIEVTHDTTIVSLAEHVCGKGAGSPLETFLAAGPRCELVIDPLLIHQGARVNASGIVVGKSAVELPTLPRPGVPTLVAFRPGVSPGVIDAELTSRGVNFEKLAAASLVQPEPSTVLTAETVGKFGDNGLRWYASYISANKLKSTDLGLSGDPVRVGIVDAGVDVKHPLLQHFFWKTTKVYSDTEWDKGSIGYDYLKKRSDPSEDENPKIDSHGTHITGLVTARALARIMHEGQHCPTVGGKWIVIRELSLAGRRGKQGSGLSKSSC